MPDYQLQLDSKTEPRVAKAQNHKKSTEKMYAGRGDTAHNFFDLGNNWGGEKNTYWEGGTPHTAHTLLMGRTIGVGTPHNLQTPLRHFKTFSRQLGWGHCTTLKETSLVDGWVGGWLVQ